MLKKIRTKNITLLYLNLILFCFIVSGCLNLPNSKNEETVNIFVAAAASLEIPLQNDIIPVFQKKYPYITVQATYDGSGKLQKQIEEGLEADIFLPASYEQMNNLIKKNLISENSVSELLENQIVLICQTGSEIQKTITSFEDIVNAEYIAIGDPASVPAGQYAFEILTKLDLWHEIKDKLSFGSNVTEVLNWVAEGSADIGITYYTDALSNDRVVKVAFAPDEILDTRIIYPIGIISSSTKVQEATLFIDFLGSQEGADIFKKYGFK